MIDRVIKYILIGLLIFTPLTFGSMEVWAFSLMELSILLILVLGVIRTLWCHGSAHSVPDEPPEIRGPTFGLPLVFVSLFLLLALFQMVPLASGIMKIVSPSTFEIRQSLSGVDPQIPVLNVAFPISFVPFATEIEFFKWLALAALFFFLLRWTPLGRSRMTVQLIVVMMLVGVGESLYGMFEYFSGHRHILHLNRSSLMTSVMGTFINRNYFAGYLLMAIPVTAGFLFSRQALRMGWDLGWRRQISSLEGKSLLIAYSIIVMILGLFFSASRMGIASLLLSLTLVSLVFRGSEREKGISKITVLILGLAVLWAAWIGLDAVVSRFFTSEETFKSRWMVWSDTFRILKDFPIFGSGLGTFAQVFPSYRSIYVQGIFTHAENDILQLASETGLLGLGFVALPFLILFLKALSGVRSLMPGDPERYIGIGGFVGILALLFHSLVERNVQVPANAFLFTFLFAMVLRIGAVKDHP